MSNDNKALAVTTPAGELAQLGSMSVDAVVARKRKIVEVMDAVMKDGEHYGKIPGCGDKPSLFKAGAEVLATTFGLAPTFDIKRVDLANGHREYEIVCTLNHIATGAVLGQGIGSCTTMESKYRWRRGERVCPDCKKPTIIKGKDEYGGGWVCFAKKGGCGHKWPDGAKEIEGQDVGRMENPDIADTYNTVLKIAKKRAQVDCTLTAVGASDLLTQDLEDLPPPANHNEPERTTPSRTQDAAPSSPPASTTTRKGRGSGKAQTNGGFGPTVTVIPLNNDEADELVEQLSKCETEKALQECANSMKTRFDASDDDIRERLERVYVEQRDQIRAAVAAERRRKAG